MKVLALGGAGQIGRSTSRKLALSPLVSEIVIAGRDLDAAKKAADEIGSKASASRLDTSDESRMGREIEGVDLVANTAGPDHRTTLPALKASIRAGIDYVDLCADGHTTEKAMRLDREARDANVTAILGMGLSPGWSNLLLFHAAQQVEKPYSLRICWFFPINSFGPLENTVARLPKAHAGNASWETIFRAVNANARVFQDGRLTNVDSMNNGEDIEHPLGGTVRAYPCVSNEPVTMPRYLPSVDNLRMVVSISPPQVNGLLHEFGEKIVKGNKSADEAMLSFFRTLLADPDRWLKAPSITHDQWLIWASVTGWKDGRKARYTCWPSSGWWMATAPPFVTAALHLLRGEVTQTGVLPPEGCFDPLPFFSEMMLQSASPLSSRPLIDENTKLLG